MTTSGLLNYISESNNEIVFVMQKKKKIIW